MENAKTKDWSQLPPDLLLSITNRLGAFEDFVAFSSVCTSWRSALSKDQNWSNRCVPWLLLREPHFSRVHANYLFIPTRNKRKKRYTVKESLIDNAKRCWGSSFGWIFTLAHDYSTALVNPLTGFQITLPRLSKSITRSLVFVNGSDKNDNGNNITVMVIYNYRDQYRLAFARPGFCEWITLQDNENGGFADVACYKDKIFGVRANGTLVMCETDNVLYPMVANFAPPPELINFNNVGRVYLIESAGDLLMALVREKFSDKKEAFEVYIFDMETRRWGKLDDLGDRALFLGDNYSISVFPANGVDCTANCIYFSTKMGLVVFYMKDRRLVVYCFTYFREKYSCSVSTDYLASLLHPSNWGPVWVRPRLS
ncbi:hypothetical protein LguiB_002182 [Lonicera macranthoides]